MGKATIIEALGEGEYTVRVDAGKDARDAEVARLWAQIASLETQIAGWQATLDAFEVQEEQPARDAVDAAQQAYIDGMKADPPPDAATVRALIAAHSGAAQALFEVRARAALLRIQLDTWRLELAQARKDLALWQAVEVEFETTAWCADATDTAAGEVGTLEVPGEFDVAATTLVIAPQEVPPTLSAGQIVAREVQTGAQAYFNAAILPGWQRHMPTYRAGRLSAIDKAADTATVVLDAARSSAQDLDINAPGVLYDVPVRYMSCNATAFEVNDRVVVEFQEQDWAQPVVIGFVTNPQRCDLIVISRRGSRLELQYSEPLDEFVWVGVPYNTEWMLFDPRNGGVSLRGTRRADNFTEPSVYSVQNDKPFFWRQKTWTERDSLQFRVDAHDGELVVLPAPIESVSIDGGEMVGVEYLGGAWSRLRVFNSTTLAAVRTLSNRIYPLRAKAKTGLVVTMGNYDGWWVRLVDHRADASLTQRIYGSDPVWDVAVSRRYYAVLVMDWINNIARVELFRRADLEPDEFGAIPAPTPCDTITLPGNGNGYGALSMTDAHVVVAQNYSTFAGSLVLVYRITDDAMTQTGSYYPWETDVDSASVFAGN